MKTIDTLVSDIKDLINGNHSVSEEAIQSFSTRLANVISERLFAREERNELRMSNIGTPCERKLWYTVSDGHVGEELPVEAKIKFLFGDILEELLLFLAEESGHSVEHRQREVEVNGIKGHVDAVIDNVVVDCKSASSYSFLKFRDHKLEGDDPFGYIDQLNVYRFGLVPHVPDLDSEQIGFLVIDKQLGHICLDLYKPNGIDYSILVGKKKDVVSSPVPPKRAYFDEPDGKSGNRKLPTPCGYCSYKHSCWPGVRTFLYAGGPRYLTNVVKLPEVPEAT